MFKYTGNEEISDWTHLSPIILSHHPFLQKYVFSRTGIWNFYFNITGEKSTKDTALIFLLLSFLAKCLVEHLLTINEKQYKFRGKKEKRFIIKKGKAYLLEEMVRTRSAFSQHSCWLWGEGCDSLSLHPKLSCESLLQSLAHLIFNPTLGCLDPWYKCCGASWQIWREFPNSQWLLEQPECLVHWLLNLPWSAVSHLGTGRSCV